MRVSPIISGCGGLAASFLLMAVAAAQPPGGQFGGPPGGQQGQGFGDGRGGPRGGERFGQLGRPGGSELLELFDADHDGELSAKEMEEAGAALKKLDKDADGKLSKEELPAKQMPGMGPGMGPPPGGPGGFGPGGFGQAGNTGNRANNNRQGNKGNKQGNRQGMPPGGPPPGGAFPGGPPPSSDELVSRALEFDADDDGKLDRDELAKFAAKMAEGPRGPERRGPEGRGGAKPAKGGGALPKF